MKLKRLLVVTAGIAALAAPASAEAAILLFDFDANDGRDFSFRLDDSRTPDTTSGFGSNSLITYRDVPGTYIDPDGLSSTANISFGTGFFSTLQVGAVFYSPNTFRGPALFDGSRTNPQFNLGTFALTGSVLNPTNGTLSVSVIPEPATWAMLLLGFFGIGAAIRSKAKLRQRVSYTM